ncbi:MAG: hypothetical protein U1C46_11415 [Bacteroidales bacterium]|nr:hypothetical protein [Bacteroidales bacterium]
MKKTQKITPFRGNVIMMILVLLLLSGQIHGQFYYGLQQNFDRSRVSFTDFFWTYYQFDDFNTYFYLNGQELAAYTSQSALNLIPEISRKLDSSPQDKIQFIIFNRLTDKHQSNIGLADENQVSSNTGGTTQVVENKVFLYFEGNYTLFDKQIREGITRVLLNQSLYGGSVVQQVSASTSTRLPMWFIEGLISYIAEPWSTTRDNDLREAFLSGRFKRFNSLQGADAVLAGHSMWKFIADKFGAAILPNIIYLTRLGKSIDQGLNYTIGISLKTLLNEWKTHYLNIYNSYQSHQLDAAQSLKIKNSKDFVYSGLRISPTGNHAAYVWNKHGRYKAVIHDLKSSKKKIVLRGGFRFDELIERSFPLMAWHPGGELLAIITEDKGLINLFLYNLRDKDMVHQYIYNFDKILDFSYANDGQRFVMSAVQQGQTNIYVYHIPSNSFEEISRGPYDDLQPRFIRNSGRIIFSSNRPMDSLNTKIRFSELPVLHNFNLFEYEYGSKKTTLRRITSEPYANVVNPVEYTDGYLAYLSDKNGIYNRYLASFDSAIAYIDTATHYRYFTHTLPITNYPRNIAGHDVQKNIGVLGEIVQHNKKHFLRLHSLMPARDITPLALQPTAYISGLHPGEPDQSGVQTTSSQLQPSDKRKRFRSVKQDETHATILPQPAPESQQIDTIPADIRRMATLDFTAFEKEVPEEKFRLPKRRNFNVEYYINHLKSQVDFSFLNATYQPFTGGQSPLYLNPGMNAFLSVTLTDLLEDYEITGGVRLNTNLVDNEYVFSFSNNKKRLNKQLVFHRQGISETERYIRHRVHELHYILTWPFTRALSLKGSLIYKHDNSSPMAIDQSSLAAENTLRLWAGLKGELIYNNTRNLGINLLSGMRWKLFGEYYQAINEKESEELTLGLDFKENMVVLGIDIRHYLPVHRNIIWANRFAASTSLGNNLLIYYLGGIDNWLIPKFNRDMAIDPSKNYTYQTIATNMRGFSQNIRNGNSFLVVNSELRIPVFSYLLNRPIRSQFINNFQLIGFVDAGTAWTGLHPYAPENHLFRKRFSQGPISGWIEMQKEPFVAGFGTGVRTSLLGYFVRADVAWGLDDGKFQKRTFFLSIGLDF